jgi:hypothetical protein
MDGIDLDRGADISLRMRHILGSRGLMSAPLFSRSYGAGPDYGQHPHSLDWRQGEIVK